MNACFVYFRRFHHLHIYNLISFLSSTHSQSHFVFIFSFRIISLIHFALNYFDAFTVSIHFIYVSIMFIKTFYFVFISVNLTYRCYFCLFFISFLFLHHNDETFDSRNSRYDRLC